MNLKTFGFKITTTNNKLIKSANPNQPIIYSINRSITFIHNKHPNPPVNQNDTKNQKANHTKILQSFNPTILQSFNRSILQSFNLSILQFFLFVVFLFSLFSINYGQVKIKEKVEIKPEVNNYLNLKKTSTVTHNVKLVLDWVQTYIGDNHDIPMNRYKFKINKYLMDKCSDIFYSDYDYSGHLEYEFTADKAVTYDFTILLSTRTEWDPNYDEDEPSGVTFQVYVDGILFKEISQSGFINPWFGYYDINLPEENIDFNQQIYTYDYRGNKCATIIGSFDNDYANISIVNGNEYLSFYDYTSLDYLGDSFYAKDYINTEYPLIIYDNPCYEDNILGIIKGEVNGAIAFDTVRINKMSEESIKVSFEPGKIFQGDTANITLQKMYGDGSLEAFPTEQKFDVNLISGTNKYGVLLSSNGIDTSNSFTQITQGFKFIAKKNILEDTVEVFLNVSTVIGNAEENVGEVNNNLSVSLGKRINNNDKQDVNKKDRVITPIDPGGGGPHEIQGTGKVIVEKELVNILLGETKYFAVKKKGDKYKIVEIPTEYGKEPKWSNVSLSDGWEWVKNSTVWNERPINISEKGTSPIFYDKLWSEISYTGKNMPLVNNLPNGMIRLIGRYWEEGREDTVTLKTISNFNSKIKIKVVKPNKLGVENKTVVGPNNITWNLDSLIIVTAGKTGILPQIIKGIIKKESLGFHPSYRYEPFADMYTTGIRLNFDSTHIYWIRSEVELGIPTIPQHNNLHLGNGDEIDGYPGYQTVWNYYSEYDSSLYKTEFYPYQQTKYNKFYKVKIDSIKKVNEIDSVTAAPIAEPLAIARYKHYLKYEIGKNGMLNVIAQTRIAASYGLMQLTYYSGVSGFKNSLAIYNYPNNDENYLPESINIPDINIEWGTKHLLGKLRQVLGSIKYLEEDTWPRNKAFDKMYWKALYSYNGDIYYPNKVFGFAKSYLPQK